MSAIFRRGVAVLWILLSLPAALEAAKPPVRSTKAEPRLPQLTAVDWTTAVAPDLKAVSTDWRWQSSGDAKKTRFRGQLELPAGSRLQPVSGIPTTRIELGRIALTGPPANQAIMCVHNVDLTHIASGNRRKITASRLMRVDLKTGAWGGMSIVPVGSDVLAVSGDGTHVLFSNRSVDQSLMRVDLYQVPKGNGAPRHVVSWEPEEKLPVRSAVVLDPKHVITETSKIALWNLPACEAAWAMPCAGIFSCVAASPDRKYLACVASDSIYILETATGVARAHLEGEHCAGELAWHPNGNLLASVQDRHVRVWDLAAGTRTVDFALPEKSPTRQHMVKSPIWCGDKHLMFEHEFLVDLDLGIVVWRYEPIHMPPPLIGQPDSRYWTCTETYGGSLMAFDLPHPAVEQAIAGAKGLFAVPAGSNLSIAVTLPDDGATRRESWYKKIAAAATVAGYRVVDQKQPIQLRVEVKRGADKPIDYDIMGRRETAMAKTFDCALTISVDGAEVWAQRTMWGGSHPLHFDPQPNETIQQRLDKMNAKSYELYVSHLPVIPPRIAYPPATAVLGTSKITATGLGPGDPDASR